MLVLKPKNDKSQFLKRLGFEQQNWEELAAEIREIVNTNTAIYSRAAPFGGDLFQVRGKLRTFGVVTIWLYLDEPKHWRFVTLYPDR